MLEAERAVTETPIETLSQARPGHLWGGGEITNVDLEGHQGLSIFVPQQCSELALTPSMFVARWSP